MTSKFLIIVTYFLQSATFQKCCDHHSLNLNLKYPEKKCWLCHRNNIIFAFFQENLAFWLICFRNKIEWSLSIEALVVRFVLISFQSALVLMNLIDNHMSFAFTHLHMSIFIPNLRNKFYPGIVISKIRIRI